VTVKTRVWTMIGVGLVALLMVVAVVYRSEESADPPTMIAAKDRQSTRPSAADAPIEPAALPISPSTEQTRALGSVSEDTELVRGIEANQNGTALSLQVEMSLVLNAQDEYYRNRLAYEEVAAATRQELLAKMAPLDAEDVGRLVAYARQKQRQFWAAGDLQDPQAYRQAYQAQVALEMAAELSDDPAVLEELTEVISAANPLEAIKLTDDGNRANNMPIVKQLIAIRQKQVELYQTQGIQPTATGEMSPTFKALMDLAQLQHIQGQYAQAAQTLQTAADQADKGGWSQYKSELQRHVEQVKTGHMMPLPMSIIEMAMTRRVGKPGGVKGAAEALKLTRPWLRRTFMFEGPAYLARISGDLDEMPATP